MNLIMDKIELIAGFIIGIIVKWIFDYFYARKKITYQKFEDHRFEAVKEFFSIYSSCQKMWLGLDHNKIFNLSEISNKELDSIIWVKLQELKAANTLMPIFFDDKISSSFDSITQRNLKLSKDLFDLRYKSPYEENDYSKVNDFVVSHNEMKRLDEEDLKKIQGYIRSLSKHF